MKKILLITTGWLHLLFVPVLLFAQTKTVTGRVTDKRSAAIAGASIAVPNTTRATAADANGRFTLTVADGATINISATGFKSQTISADAATSELTIQLEEDVARLDEVVVTGLATSVKRRNLANAVATISSKELSGTAPAQTLDAALNGKIPGAYINANSGAPGGGISVKLRGVTSVYGTTQPLYVVDGVFMDNSTTSAGLNAVTKAASGGLPTSTQDNASNRVADLRPEDIENIEILKGASAAAIYGSRAAAGVIIITTKRGKQGKTSVNVSQDLGLITARKLLGVREFTADRAAGLSGDSVTSLALRQQFLDAQSAGHIYDYEKEIYGNTGFARNTAISMTGGGEKTTFYFSAAQKDEEGIVKNTGYRNNSLRLNDVDTLYLKQGTYGYRNNSLRLNVDHRITDAIKIGISTSYINSSADRGLFGNDNAGITTSIALSSTPSFTELHPDANGNYPNNPFAAANPLQTIALMRNNESVNRFITGLNFDATFQKSNRSATKFVARGGLDFFNLQSNVLFPGILQLQAVNKGTSIQGFTKSLSTNYILSLVNTYTPSTNLSLTTSAGITQETGDYNNILDIATQIIAGQSNAELILIYAEANIQLDNLSEGVKAINIIRNGHGLSSYSGAETKDALIDELLKQRRYSLYFEGHRWIDLRRYNRLNELPVDRQGDDVWSEFPLPVTEQ